MLFVRMVNYGREPLNSSITSLVDAAINYIKGKVTVNPYPCLVVLNSNVNPNKFFVDPDDQKLKHINSSLYICT